MVRFHALHDSRRYTIPLCWAPHTQTHICRARCTAMMKRLVLSYYGVKQVNLYYKIDFIYLSNKSRSPPMCLEVLLRFAMQLTKPAPGT